MKRFSFISCLNICFGDQSVLDLPEILKQEHAQRVLLVSDHGLEKLGAVKKVQDIIKAAGLGCVEFLDVEANPSIQTVKNAVKQFQSAKADALVALGGGSPMDVSKSVAILARYGGEPADYVGGGKVPGPVVPLVAIPTTAGTGSEVTAFSVITDTEKNYKISIKDDRIVPKYALLDPQFIMTAPQSVAASCGVDALIHAMEAYVSLRIDPVCEAFAEKAMQLLGRSIRPFVANRQNAAAAQDMLLGSALAGIAFTRAGLGNIHAMSHPVSAHFHVPHGVANAILMPHIAAYNALTDNGKCRKIYEYVTGMPAPTAFNASMLAPVLAELNRALGIPARLSDVGVTPDRIEAMADDAMKSGNIFTNPRQSTRADIVRLYHEAL